MERAKIISKTFAVLLFGIAFGLMGQQMELESMRSVQSMPAQQFIAHYKTTLDSNIVHNIFLGLTVRIPANSATCSGHSGHPGVERRKTTSFNHMVADLAPVFA